MEIFFAFLIVILAFFVFIIMSGSTIVSPKKNSLAWYQKEYRLGRLDVSQLGDYYGALIQEKIKPLFQNYLSSKQETRIDDAHKNVLWGIENSFRILGEEAIKRKKSGSDKYQFIATKKGQQDVLAFIRKYRFYLDNFRDEFLQIFLKEEIATHNEFIIGEMAEKRAVEIAKEHNDKIIEQLVQERIQEKLKDQYEDYQQRLQEVKEKATKAVKDLEANFTANHKAEIERLAEEKLLAFLKRNNSKEIEELAQELLEEWQVEYIQRFAQDHQQIIDELAQKKAKEILKSGNISFE